MKWGPNERNLLDFVLNRRKYVYIFTAGFARDAVYLGSDCSGSCNSFAAEREPEAPAGHQVGPGFHNSYLAQRCGSGCLFRVPATDYSIPDPGVKSAH
jgi:hypothetical protein